ncbi:MAG: uroporphyrinogen-III synthase [Anaerolineales bacterium]
MSDKPLAERTIVVTRPRHQAGEMMDRLRELGAEPILVPAIEIRPKSDLSALDEALRRLEDYRWLIFTSANAVRITLGRAQELDLSLNNNSNLRVATIGPATADALAEFGLEAEFVPASFIAEEVAAGLPEADGARVLLPRAEGAREVLPEDLEARGATVDEIQIYESVQGHAEPEALLRVQEGVDAITFTSPSTAKNFTSILKAQSMDPISLPGDPLIACIGPITAEAAGDLEYQVGLIADKYTSEGLIHSLVAHYKGMAVT